MVYKRSGTTFQEFYKTKFYGKNRFQNDKLNVVQFSNGFDLALRNELKKNGFQCTLKITTRIKNMDCLPCGIFCFIAEGHVIMDMQLLK